jgi:DNA-binding LacI/PurR family transcriptional regulator
MAILGQKAEKIYHTLLEDIENGNYKTNSRLPTEKELCQKFKCCHNTVRKALERLIDEEKIESMRGSGSYVKNDAVSSANNFLSLMYMGDQRILTLIQDIALKQNCVLVFYSQNRTHWDLKSERKFFQRIKEQNHKGLLAFCSPASPYNEDILQQIQASGTMVIHYEYYKETFPNENFILPDYRQAGYLGVTTLMLSGYHKLYYCGLENDGPYGKLQEKGFLTAINEHSSGALERKYFSEFRTEGNFFRMPRMGFDKDADNRLDDFIGSLTPGTGLYCNTTERAVIMQEEIIKRGKKVPEDIGLISTATLNPHEKIHSLDYIKFDRDAIFKQALNAIFAPKCNGIHELVPPILVRNGKTLRANL